MAKASFQLDPNAVAYTDDEIVGKVNTATDKVTRADSVEVAAILESATELLMSDTERTKLTGIEEGADVNPADLDGVPDSATRKAMLDAERTKLTGVEADAKDDQSGAEIKTAYEAEENAYTDTKDTKLSGVEANAKDDQTGEEVRDVILGLSDTERKLVKTDPQTGEFPVLAVQRKSDGKMGVDYDDVPA